MTLSICLIYGAEIFLWRGDEHVAAALIDELIAVAEKHSRWFRITRVRSRQIGRTRR